MQNSAAEPHQHAADKQLLNLIFVSLDARGYEFFARVLVDVYGRMLKHLKLL
jgi:hypothetical protein